MRIIFLILLVVSYSPSAESAGALQQRKDAIEQQHQQIQAKQAAQQAQQQQAQQAIYQQQLTLRALQQQRIKSMSESGAPLSSEERSMIDETPSKILTIEDIWQELEISTEIWPLILDANPKTMTVGKYIEWYEKQGIHIRRPADSYVRTVDEMASSRSELLKNPFKDVLMFIAVMEYDFDNGQDPDKFALQILGRELYAENRKRLGLDQEKQK